MESMLRQLPPEADESLTAGALGDTARRSVAALMPSRRNAWTALKVALRVGTALNLVNHGEPLWHHDALKPWQVALDAAAPYCVSSRSTARNASRCRVAP